MTPEPALPHMYDDLAWTWPLVSPPQDYVREANSCARLIRRFSAKKSRTRSLLDLGCGGGHNDYTLKKHFQVTGVDLSPGMLALARSLNPEASYFEGDLRSVRLGQTFDAVLCADSIDYMLTEDDLLAAFTTAYVHLNAGGVFVTYAEATPERFEQNRTFSHTARQGPVEIAFLRNDYDPDPNDTTYEMTFVYLIRQAGKQEIVTDHHTAGIFPLETWLRLLRRAGFQVYQEESIYGDPTFIGVK